MGVASDILYKNRKIYKKRTSINLLDAHNKVTRHGDEKIITNKPTFVNNGVQYFC